MGLGSVASGLGSSDDLVDRFCVFAVEMEIVFSTWAIRKNALKYEMLIFYGALEDLRRL